MAQMFTDKKYPSNPHNPRSKLASPIQRHVVTQNVRAPPNG
jgi:hypothetical protein